MIPAHSSLVHYKSMDAKLRHKRQEKRLKRLERWQTRRAKYIAGYHSRRGVNDIEDYMDDED